MQLLSWNVNGIRAVEKKGFISIIKDLQPDVMCLQETKAQDNQVVEALRELPDKYFLYSNSAERKGYSGTAIITATEPQYISYGIGIKEHDNEGRVISAEFKDFYLVTVYVPNSGGELARLQYRKDWNRCFQKYLVGLNLKKPVIICGDLNVAHQPIDLKNPKSNYNKTSGYTQDEIDGMDNLLSTGFIDTFRYQHPDEVAYSWWSYRFSARAKNIGWRIDYFLVSESIINNVTSSFILPKIMGSDHCPVGVHIIF